MLYIRYGWGAGFAIFMGVLLIAAIIYTVIKVRKQAHRAEEREKKQKRGNRDKRSDETT